MTIFELSKYNITTNNWEEVTDTSSLTEKQFPLSMGVAESFDSPTENIKVINNKEEAILYFNKLRKAYGEDAKIILTDIPDSPTFEMVVTGSTYNVSNNVDVTSANNFNSFIEQIRSIIVNDNNKIKLECTIDNNEIKVMSVC